ncbi:DUF4240 domain-containing protein [Nocardia huaxiensis]|uniref:DUF4240 domain-containing protein n=1 Tax=Nocardia huaxiensis TaxID=2755382 RepID=UPI001E4E2A9E|nr:DUF4240 domain-containing protein [Nocardia huaxiensis]UFS97238.1 DUF4240 domain-containing protein [Nocardia huaxiensis]
MNKIPTPADESQFWSLLEAAWERVGAEPNALRKSLAGRTDDADAYALDEHLPAFLEHLTALSADLSAEQLTALDRVAERKLHDLDRADIHEVTDGSDDGFLYCRGFILAMGHDFHAAVLADPSTAILDAECESLCYFFAHLHNTRFGDFPDTGSGISRESFSNPSGWS